MLPVRMTTVPVAMTMMPVTMIGLAADDHSNQRKPDLGTQRRSATTNSSCRLGLKLLDCSFSLSARQSFLKGLARLSVGRMPRKLFGATQ
jgi:hypothetical protein